MGYQIMTDSTCDLPYYFLEERDIRVVNIPYVMDGGEPQSSDLKLNQQRGDFYAAMRGGAIPKTSSVNVVDYLKVFAPIIAQRDILFISFSSAMSSTFLNMQTARDTLLKEHPERKFVIVDTLSVSMGLGLLVLEACDMRDAGASLEETAAEIARKHMHSQVIFMVEDLVYLKRGGRITGAAAVVGSLLNLKPILVVNRGGLVIPVEKARGSKQALRSVLQRFDDIVVEPQNQRMAIVHADAQEQAEAVRQQLIEKYSPKEVLVAPIGPIVGTHAGPGTLGVCVIGKERETP